MAHKKKCERCKSYGRDPANDATEPHSCPYQHEINDIFDEGYCTCCDDCRGECSADI